MGFPFCDENILCLGRMSVQHSECTKCNSVPYLQIINSVNIVSFKMFPTLLYLCLLCMCIYVCSGRWRPDGNFQQSFFPFYPGVSMYQSQGIRPGASVFTCWAILLARTSSFTMCLKSLPFLRRCHLLYVLFVFSKQNWTDVKKWVSHFWAKVMDSLKVVHRDTRWAAVQKSLTRRAGASSYLQRVGVLSLVPRKTGKGRMHLYRQKVGWSVDGLEKEDQMPNTNISQRHCDQNWHCRC